MALAFARAAHAPKLLFDVEHLALARASDARQDQEARRRQREDQKHGEVALQSADDEALCRGGRRHQHQSNDITAAGGRYMKRADVPRKPVRSCAPAATPSMSSPWPQPVATAKPRRELRSVCGPPCVGRGRVGPAVAVPAFVVFACSSPIFFVIFFDNPTVPQAVLYQWYQSCFNVTEWSADLKNFVTW